MFQLQTSLQLGSKLLKGLGVMSDDVSFLRQIVRDSMELQAQEALSKNDEQESNVMEPLQVLNNLLSKKCEQDYSEAIHPFNRLLFRIFG